MADRRAAKEAMEELLVRGVALGENRREPARHPLRRLEGDFNGGLACALNIARTEIFDAHRDVAAASLAAHSEATGWLERFAPWAVCGQ